MKVFALLGVSSIEGHWQIKNLVDVCVTREAAERIKDELTKQLPAVVNAEGVKHYWHDEEIYEYEIEERELRE